MTPRSEAVRRRLAIVTPALAPVALVTLGIYYLLTGHADPILLGTFGLLLGAGLYMQALAARE